MKLTKHLALGVFLFAITIITAQDWSGISIPADAGNGMKWELDAQHSDDFNYSGKSNAAFTSKWNDRYHNAWTGPGLTYWESDHSDVRDGNLIIRASRSSRIDPEENIPMVNCGVITSKTKVQFPFYAEISMKVMNQVLSSNFWMLSADDRQELDVIETYGGDRPDQQKEASHMNSAWHIFDRDPVTNAVIMDRNWQRDHFTPNNEPLRNKYHRLGVHLIDAWHIQWYFDGRLVRTTSPESTENPIDAINDPLGFAKDPLKAAIYDEMFMIIDVEDHEHRSRNGNIVATDAELANNSKNKMFVDWVRFYKPVSGNGGPTNVAVTGVSVAPTSASVNVGQNTVLSASVSPPNASNKSVSWSSSNTNVATVNESGSVRGVAAGTVTITATTADGNRTATARVTVNGGGTPPPTGGNGLIIEAENFVTTGGTFNDGQVPLGVNKTAVGINYVNAGDYAEYTISVEAGTYAITYQVSTPSDNAEITFKADGNTVSRDAVPNNGQWDSYQPLRAGRNVILSTGTHTIRIEASGSNQWQWNMDKIELTKVGGTTPAPVPTPTPIPTPPSNGASLVIQAEDFSNTGGAFGGFQTYDVGGVTATNFNQTGDWAEYTVNISQSGTYGVEYFISTPLDGPAIEFIVDGVSQMKDNVSNNGSWNSFVSMKASRSVTLSSGSHVIRLLGAGTNGWEWNLDRFVLKGNGGKSIGLDTSALRIYPNPAKESFNIAGIDNKEFIVNVYDVRGVNYINQKINASNHQVQINDLSAGVYFVQIQDANALDTRVFKLLKSAK